MNSRLFTLVLFFLTFGLFASASPVEMQERDVENVKRAAQVGNVVTNLVSQVNGILPLMAGASANDAVAHVNALTNVFASSAANINGLSAIALATADQTAMAKNLATVLNDSANQLSKLPQTAAVIAATVKLDLQIELFLNRLGLIIFGLLGLLARLIIDLRLFLAIHLVLVANIFINLLGIVIIL